MTASAAGAAGRSLLNGGSTLAGAILLANAGNYALNLFLARALTPAEFSDANLMVTTMSALTSIALCLQLVASRFIARADEAGFAGDGDSLAVRLRRVALSAGVVAAVALAAGAPAWSQWFHTASAWPFVILGAGVPVWLAQAVGRGVMQARLAFRPLAASFVLEMVARLGLGIFFVTIGWGVSGATAALTASFIVTSAFVSWASRPAGGANSAGISSREVRAYAAMVSVLLFGQIVANNSDVFVAKAVFSPHEAGIYAAVALVGRAVFFLAWSVATVVFPVAARRQVGGGGTRSLLWGGMAVILGIGIACSAGALVVGGPVLGALIGPEYASISVPLAAYAGATTLFSIGNFIASISLSRGLVGDSWFLLVAAIAQLCVLLAWHTDITALIIAQYIAMISLLIGLGAKHIIALGYRKILTRKA